MFRLVLLCLVTLTVTFATSVGPLIGETEVDPKHLVLNHIDLSIGEIKMIQAKNPDHNMNMNLLLKLEIIKMLLYTVKVVLILSKIAIKQI